MGLLKAWGVLAITFGALVVLRLILSLILLVLGKPLNLSPLDSMIIVLAGIVFFPIAIIYYAAKQ